MRASVSCSTGYEVDDATFDEVLAYTRHKASITGHSEDYVPLLLADELRNHIFRERVNTFSRLYREGMAEFLDHINKEAKQPCAAPV